MNNWIKEPSWLSIPLREVVVISCAECGKSLGPFEKKWEGIPIRCKGGCTHTEPEDERLPPVLIYRDGDFVRAETDEEIALRKWKEWQETLVVDGDGNMIAYDRLFPEWLQQEDK